MVRDKSAKKPAKGRATGRKLAQQVVPDVYQEMLADATPSSPSRIGEEGRALKRRRVGGRIVTQGDKEASLVQSQVNDGTAENSDFDELFEDVEPTQQQIVETDSEDSADSDVDWEEVQLKDDGSEDGTPEPNQFDEEGLNLVLNDHEKSSKLAVTPKRKPLTVEDKKLRLEIHKMHVCCLLVHVYLRNHWCNDEKVYTAMRKTLTKKMISYLNPDEDSSQFQRSRSFMDGLAQASEAFRGVFRITARGMGKSRWADGPETLALLQPPDDIDLPMQIADFREAAQHLEGSRDVGAQLFCAMVRSAGVDARLVCSLQPLPFQPAPKVDLQQVKHRVSRLEQRKAQFQVPNEEPDNGSSGNTAFNGGSSTSRGKRSASPAVELLSSKIKRKPLRESKYPIYWVEAFNEAVQKWVPVDPLVTKTIAKSAKFEPPAGEPQNSMSYVLGFEDDGSARDVTKRYVKAYNAKTRRERVEVVNGGERWWRRVMKMYRRHQSTDRDQLEDAELATKEAAEPMPRNVQDFKDHPYYALERHLKRHEALHPRREVGKVGAGRVGGTNTLEPIFRRRDVHPVKSADKWYRLGREIKPGEQPLKRVPARRNRQRSVDPEHTNPLDEDNAGTALYAVHQTTLYTAPPVVNGLIPKNTYGNLDVYVSSMVPPGGVHIPHPKTAKAAKIIGVGYADAVTGFSFKGRHGTAIINGAVIAREYREAIEEVIRAFENDRIRAEEEKRSLEALKTWKRLLAGLRIRQRIDGYEVEGERDAKLREDLDTDEDENEDSEAGGFFPDPQGSTGVQPTADRFLGSRSPDGMEEDQGGGFLPEEVEDPQPSQHEVVAAPRRDPFIDSIENDDAGGFLINDDDADAEEELRQKEESSNRVISTAPDQSQSFLSERTDLSGPRQNRPSTDDIISTQTNSKQELIRNANQAPDQATGEESAMADEHTQQLRIVEANHQPVDLAAAGLLPEDLEEARLLEQVYESNAHSHVPMPPNGEVSAAAKHVLHTQRADTDLPQDLEENGDANFEVSTSMIQENSAVDELAEAASPESDNGSLLSQDPEDEDAEPEWLT